MWALGAPCLAVVLVGCSAGSISTGSLVGSAVEADVDTGACVLFAISGDIRRVEVSAGDAVRLIEEGRTIARTGLEYDAIDASVEPDEPTRCRFTFDFGAVEARSDEYSLDFGNLGSIPITADELHDGAEVFTPFYFEVHR